VSARGWLLFAAMSVIWGVPYLMIKVAVEGGVSVSFVVFSRLAIGALVLVPIALSRGNAGGLVLRHVGAIVAFATLEMIVPWWLLADAERDISSGMAGLLIAAAPIVAVAAAWLAGDPDQVTATRIGGLVLGFLGVLLLAMGQLHGGSTRAVVEMALVTVLYATAPRMISGRLARIPPLSLTAACLAFGTVVYAVPAWSTRPTTWPQASVLASLAGLGIICTATAFVVFFELIRLVGPSRALVFTYVNPAVALGAGVLLLDETLSVQILTAFALILVGSVLAARSSRLTLP
jgi:drug/metabolite transporter (DMT)-like permease